VSSPQREADVHAAWVINDSNLLYNDHSPRRPPLAVQAEVRPAKFFLRLTHDRQIADLQFLAFSIFLLPNLAGK
jgi:hypothetical protein